MRTVLRICLRFFVLALGLGAMAVGAQERFAFDSTPGLLSKDVRPSHYRLRLNVDPAATHFSGEVNIRLRLRKPSDGLRLHAQNLQSDGAQLQAVGATAVRALRIAPDATTQTWALLPQDGKPIAPGTYQLRIAYSGKVNESDSGLYRAPYTADGQPKFMLATQLEAVFARMLFPNFDEPAFRSVFDITVQAPANYAVFSNMPVRSIATEGAARVHRFGATPPMSSYLVAVTVGQFDVLSGLAARVPLRIITSPGKLAQARYAMQATEKILPYYNDYFGVPYALPKLDQLAVPSTRSGAMEDWGLISYGETALLFDAARSSEHRRMRVFETIAHEVAHQWFGNLVTAASWEEIWLNEAFATWLAEKATDKFNPDWQIQLRRRQPIDHAMADDASSATRAIRSGAVQEDRVFDVFDNITYVKGGAVLSMLEGWMGPEVFRQGLSSYMKQRRMSNATAGDLWFHIGQASGRDVARVARSWTDQKGFPLVTVQSRCESGQTVLDLRQSRFSSDTAGVASLGSANLWSIPLVVMHGGREHALLLEQASQTFTLPQCSDTPSVLNPGGQGFYRVQYAPAHRAALVRGFGALPATARIALLSDTFALVQSAQLPLATYLELLQAIPAIQGPDRAAMIDMARDGLGFLDEAFLNTPSQMRLRERALALLAPELQALGWQARANDDIDARMLRNGLIASLAHLGDASVRAQAAQLFDQEAAGGPSIAPEIRDAVLSAAGMSGDAERFAQLKQRLLSATNEEDRWRYARALANTTDPVLAQQVLALSLAGTLPNNVAARLPSMVSNNPIHNQMAYQYVLDNFPRLAQVAGEMFGSSAWLVPGAGGAFNTPERADQLVQDQQRLAGDKGARTAARMAAHIRLKAALVARDAL
jgi:aminopeptidase N